MSYKCESCQQVMPRGTPARCVVAETREHEHPRRAKANRDGSDDPGGKGTQIVKERIVCPRC